MTQHAGSSYTEAEWRQAFADRQAARSSDDEEVTLTRQGVTVTYRRTLPAWLTTKGAEVEVRTVSDTQVRGVITECLDDGLEITPDHGRVCFIPFAAISIAWRVQ